MPRNPRTTTKSQLTPERIMAPRRMVWVQTAKRSEGRAYQIEAILGASRMGEMYRALPCRKDTSEILATERPNPSENLLSVCAPRRQKRRDSAQPSLDLNRC